MPRRDRRVRATLDLGPAELDLKRKFLKGDPETYDKFRTAVRQLRPYADQSLSAVRKTPMGKTVELVEFTAVSLHDYTDEYNRLQKIVDEEWSDFDRSSLRRGTVAANLLGCTVFEPCQPGCVGTAMQRSKIDGGSCSHTVITATLDSTADVVDFSIDNPSDSNSSSALFYFQGDFSGLTKAEKSKLSQFGIKSIKIHDSNGPQTDDYISIDEVRERTSGKMSKGSGDLKWLWILLAILLIILVIWLVMKNRK